MTPALLLLIFSTYFWVCVFFPRWRIRGYWRGTNTPIGTFGHAGYAVVCGLWALGFIGLSVNDSPVIGIIGFILVFLISFLAVEAGRYADIWIDKGKDDLSL
jgi:hypothetical protein